MAGNLEQRIRERAYEIWEEEGCPEGRGDEHWQRALAEYEEARIEAGDGQATLAKETVLEELPQAAADGPTRASSRSGG